MKRLVSIVCSLMLVLAALPEAVSAGNGPKAPFTDYGETQDWAFIRFYELDSTGSAAYNSDGSYKNQHDVYAQSRVDNSTLAGAAYDKASNTLTITNLKQPSLALSANMMGDDFTLKVAGSCELAELIIWGDGYGGTLNIEGDGTLTVNKGKIVDCAIVLNAESSASALKIGREVSLNLYAKENIAQITYTTVADKAKAVVYGNGTTPAVTQEEDVIGKSICGYQITDLDNTTTSWGGYGHKQRRSGGLLCRCGEYSLVEWFG